MIMSRYEKLLNMIMDFNGSIRLAVISDTSGEILWNAKRKDTKLKIPLAETKKALRREASDWVERCKLEDRNNIGRAMYNISSFEKIKRISLPIDAFHLLFISVDNEPLTKSKTKSYGKLVEMGKIMSIVDFVNTFE